jgi:hypothetical protein
MRQRLAEPRARRAAPDIWVASYVLMGVRYSEQFTAALIEEVLGMEESTTYQAIIRKGRAEEARRMLLIVGEGLLGTPDDATISAVQAITDVERLESLARQVPHIESWQQLLAPPARGRRRRSE